jgi:hypothetical protein
MHRLAVLRLMTSSNFVDGTMGWSTGLALALPRIRHRCRRDDVPSIRPVLIAHQSADFGIGKCPPDHGEWRAASRRR